MRFITDSAGGGADDDVSPEDLARRRLALAGWRAVIPRGEVVSLLALSLGASSSRVLNLAMLKEQSGHLDAFHEQPFFECRALNGSIIVRHRLRSNEVDLIGPRTTHATKILVPLDPQDLSIGGMSVFVGERGWIDRLQERYPEITETCRDVEVLKLLDSAPSLDPFVMDQLLTRAGVEVAACYFDLNAVDVDRMRQFVSGEVRSLVDITGFGDDVDGTGATRMADALLTDARDERMAALSKGFGMNPADFREGVFAWRGFLYYKFQFVTLVPDMRAFTRGLRDAQFVGSLDPYARSAIAEMIRRIIGLMSRIHTRTAASVQGYDRAYEDFTQRGEVAKFRTFLLAAPDHFMRLGEAVGTISDIVSYWRFTFPEGASPTLPAHEAHSFLHEIEQSLIPILDGASWTLE